MSYYSSNSPLTLNAHAPGRSAAAGPHAPRRQVGRRLGGDVLRRDGSLTAQSAPDADTVQVLAPMASWHAVPEVVNSEWYVTKLETVGR
jgi:hypothetical protein